MIKVTLVSNDGAGLPVELEVVDDITLKQFLEVHFENDPDDYTVKVRSNGVSVQIHEDYVLQDGDRVSMAPVKVDGS